MTLSLDIDETVGDEPCLADAPDEDTEEDAADDTTDPPARPRWRSAAAISVVMTVALATLLGWLAFQDHQARLAQAHRAALLQVAKQGALNLTTIDWQHAQDDVQRILDSATGQFHDDFSIRSGPFIDVIQKARAVTVGTIVEAGLEAVSDDAAQALVAVSVLTSNAGTPDPQPRYWRLRVYVTQVDDQVRVSNVEFVA